MKKGASGLLKNIISLFSSVTRSKSAIKSKVEAIKAKVIIFSLLKNKKLPLTLKRGGSISHKIHALLLGGSATSQDQDTNESTINADNNMQLVLHKENSLGDGFYNDYYVEDDEDNKYPDLRHCLFDEEEDDEDPNASVIDLVKSSMEHDGEDFKLEDEIDHVADLFIMKFHKRMRLQKLESFKRYQEMLERSS